MRKKMASMALLIAVFFLCSTAAAATDDVLGGMGKKFFRGLVNILTGWVELPMQTIKGFKGDYPVGQNDKILGTVGGFIKGISCTVGRTAWGALELAGFWTANPEDNEGIGVPLDADYAWEGGDTFRAGEFDFMKGAVEPIGRKLMRGLGNGLCGFAELPGQIAKGIKGGAPDLGIIKGLWFWYSREIYGIGDLATAIFPAPADNPGCAFDEEYPWDALFDTLGE